MTNGEPHAPLEQGGHRKQIHHRAPAPAPQGLFDHRQIFRRLRLQREGFEEFAAPGIEFVQWFEDGLRPAEPRVAHYTTVAAAVRSRLNRGLKGGTLLMKKLLVPLVILVAIPTAFIGVALGANWITTCNMSHSNNDDAIVFRAQAGASHRHVYVGARNTNAFSTPSSMRAAGTTCGMSGDTSAYWVPQALRYNLGTSKHALFYYKGDANTRPFPDGLKIIVGNAKATSPSQNPGIASGRIKFKCGPGSGTETAAPPARCSSGVMVPVVEFPNCWNGRDLDSPDHFSHMAYGGSRCPKSHPVSLPRIKAYVRYAVGTGPIDFSLSSGPYYTFHMDFLNAWVPSELQRFIDRCMKTGGDCGTNPS